jgi:hypothetical protein
MSIGEMTIVGEERMGGGDLLLGMEMWSPKPNAEEGASEYILSALFGVRGGVLIELVRCKNAAVGIVGVDGRLEPVLPGLLVAEVGESAGRVSVYRAWQFSREFGVLGHDEEGTGRPSGSSIEIETSTSGREE